MNKEELKTENFVYSKWLNGYIIGKILKIGEEYIYGVLSLVNQLPKKKTDKEVYKLEINKDNTFLGYLNIDEIHTLDFEDEIIEFKNGSIITPIKNYDNTQGKFHFLWIDKEKWSKTMRKLLESKEKEINEYKQQIYDKLTVLNSLINLSLDTGNKEAFEVYTKEFNELNE